jgi:hypothetical protein
MPHEIHGSERRSFSCRRRWSWLYRDGYLPNRSVRHLEFGTAYHKALQVFYEPKTWLTTSPDEKLEGALSAFSATCASQALHYLEVNQVRELPPDLQEDYDSRVALGVGMLEYYADYVHPEFDKWFKPIMVEVPFEVTIDDPDSPSEQPLTCKNSPHCGQVHNNDGPDSLVVYAGRVDVLIEDLRYGGYFVLDWKTASTLTVDDSFLQLDDQSGGYVWALRRKLNLDVRGFLYCEIRKAFPQPPKLLKRQSGGRIFSTSKDQPTSIEIFEPYVRKNDPIAYENGAYNDFIAHLKSNDATQYHQRFPIIKSDVELNNIGYNIGLQAADMIDPGLRIYPSVGKFSCSKCAFRQPCLSMFMGEDVEYQLRTSYTKSTRRYWMDNQTTDKSSK